MLRFRLPAVMLIAAVLAGCPAGVRTPRPAPSVPSPAAPTTVGATIYSIDAAASEVSILVYRGGTLARLGHNHVITAKSLTGEVAVSPMPERSSFALSFPVAELVVDDTQARQAAGAEFPGSIEQPDREGTRKNMLRAEVLDAEHFARVSLRSLRVMPPLPSAQVLTRITIREVSRDIDVPVSIEVTPTKVTATGQFPVKQTDFGIKPFSVGFGALEVVDQVQIRFKVVANRK